MSWVPSPHRCRRVYHRAACRGNATRTAAMDFAQFRHEVRTWLAANPPARAERIPHDEASLADEFAFLRDWQRRLHAAGYVGLLWPRAYGGRGAHPAAPKHRGISYFLLDMRASGITVRPLRQATGSTEFSEVFLDRVRVGPEQLVGAVNQGWDIAMTTLAHERGTGFAFKEQVLQRIALEDAIALARTRRRAADPV